MPVRSAIFPRVAPSTALPRSRGVSVLHLRRDAQQKQTHESKPFCSHLLIWTGDVISTNPQNLLPVCASSQAPVGQS
jgi:hypothetical protein